MANKQTAVQWLQEKLFELEINIDSKTHEEAFFLFEQAKQMEKEQIKDAFVNYFYSETLPLNDKRALYKIAEQYYNETYGKE